MADPPIKPKPTFKIWLETEDGFVFGPGVYSLLKKATETGTLKDSAKALGMSYRFAWGLLKKAEERLGQKLVETRKGGKAGGGGIELTKVGQNFLNEFSKIEIYLYRLLENPELLDSNWRENQLTVKVKEICTGEGNSEIRIVTEEPVSLIINLPNEITSKHEIQKEDKLFLTLLSIVKTIKKL